MRALALPWRCLGASSGAASETVEVFELGQQIGAYRAATGGLDEETLAKLAKVNPAAAAALRSIERQLRGDT